MTCEYGKLSVYCRTETEMYAARLFSNEILKRTGFDISFESEEDKAVIVFKIKNAIANPDTYIIEKNSQGYTFCGKTVRGLIYAYSHFLRKSVFKNGKHQLICDIEGLYTPQKAIRGHQVGYRTTPNTYDAWDYSQYFRYQLDLMAFGANTIEHNGSKNKGEFKNKLMKYEQEEFLKEATALADKVDLNVSLWHANDDDEEFEDAVKTREKLYSTFKRLDYLFPPGSDPGKLPADEFIKRCRAFSRIAKKYHPGCQMHPSAQQPHSSPEWGSELIRILKEQPDEIDDIIMGPNHAYPIHELREKVPEKYPLRFYPDITHNLRCEYPVNFTEDDWNYTFANTLSRESVNPRPTEFRKLHRLHSQYTIGSVSYSEGVHDDVNKAVWSALEWDKDADLREILSDYARFFIYEAESSKIADIIFLLEKSWQGHPLENPCIDTAYEKLLKLKNETPELSENWRFMLLYFRGLCDKIVKTRCKFEEALCKKARKHLASGNINEALKVLSLPFDEDYTFMREELSKTGKLLFNLIGIQLDVEHYLTDNWERGATLDTIDNNITDRAFLLSKIKLINELPEESKKDALTLLLNRNKTESDETHFSIALHGLYSLGVHQQGEFYMDIQGDRPEYKENPLPMAMTKVYDHFTFKGLFGGFKPKTDYILTVTYKSDINEKISHHTVKINGNTIYEGPQFGGEKSPEADRIILQKGFESASYFVDNKYIHNGAVTLEIGEPTEGVKLCELWFKKK